GHVGITLELELRRVVVGVLQKVEAANFVRAIVRAIPRADAAVVDHEIQPGAIVHGRGDRANQLARRVLAMHARHRLVQDSRAFRVAFEIPIDANPGHLTPAQDLLAPDDRDVVLRLAGDRAGAAADARIEVDDHAPRGTFVAYGRI